MENYIYEDKLESERLITRKLIYDDRKIWCNFLSDKEAVEFFPDFGEKSAEERALYWIDKQMGRYAENRYGLQALINKQTNEFIGQCGLLLQEVNGKTEVEVGYHIFKKYWGQGYAPEAAKLFLNYGFKNDQATSIISIIHTKNKKSQRVAEKNGLIRGEEATWMELPVFIYRINKE